MSKIGKQPIEIPEGVEIKIGGGKITAKGEFAEIEKKYPKDKIKVIQNQQELKISPASSDKQAKSLWGTWRSIIENMIKGAKEGFTKELELEGIGFRARTEGEKLVIDVGYSHPITIEPPKGITFETEEKNIKVKGADKQKVGNISAFIRSYRPPEPYKGKGIRYKGEHIRRKEGKKAVGLEE